MTKTTDTPPAIPRSRAEGGTMEDALLQELHDLERFALERIASDAKSYVDAVAWAADVGHTVALVEIFIGENGRFPDVDDDAELSLNINLWRHHRDATKSLHTSAP